jgi:two-component system sensor histidine kinase KdpD
MQGEVGSIDTVREQMHRQMLSAVSHDLKTPLATMIGSLEIHDRMYDRLTEEKRKSLIASALLEAYRLDHFISNILDMAKLENGMVKACPSRFDLVILIQDEIIRLGPRQKRGTFHLDLLPETLIVLSDATLVGRVIGILLDNALKHAGPEPHIWIVCGVENDGMVLHVRDSGSGIPAGKEEEIFSKYTRLHRADQQNAGTGLGLSIGRAIAGVLNGNLSGKNADKGGAEFTLRLAAA